MDLLVEKGNNKTYLSQLGFLVTSFEEGAPSIARNSTNIQGRSGSVDFGGWHESKKVKLEGFYRAEDQYEEETLKERLFALLSDPEGIYITEMRGEIGQGFERPGETEGEVYEHMMTRPSHKRFYVYASSIENELQGNIGGTVLYKMSVEFTTLKLPYGESVPRDLAVNPNVPYYGRNLLTNAGDLSANWDLTNKVSVDNSQKPAVLHYTMTTLTSSSYTIAQQQLNDGLLQPSTTYTASFYAKGTGTFLLFCYPSVSTGVSDTRTRIVLTSDYKLYTITFTTVPNLSGNKNFLITQAYSPSATDQNTVEAHVYGFKLEKGSAATPWSPSPADPEYNAWYTKIYYNTDNLVIPYAGTVPCNQLEQGFTVEFTAKEGGSGLKIDINGKEFVYDGQVYDGDVLKLSGYEYTKNGLSVVRTTNKAYFKLLPNVNNTLSASLHGTIKVLNFQNLYA
ncbi:hypothetical protein [Lactobacillus phage Sabazios]|nr:hypothetical protein [Lactobacillus phage Sabazios]